MAAIDLLITFLVAVIKLLIMSELAWALGFFALGVVFGVVVGFLFLGLIRVLWEFCGPKFLFLIINASLHGWRADRMQICL